MYITLIFQKLLEASKLNQKATLARKSADSFFILRVCLQRLYSSNSKSTDKTSISDKPEKPSNPSKRPGNTDVPVPEKLDNTQYKVPEYYQYNYMSFYDLECEMSNYRLPQQSKFGHKAA